VFPRLAKHIDVRSKDLGGSGLHGFRTEDLYAVAEVAEAIHRFLRVAYPKSDRVRQSPIGDDKSVIRPLPVLPLVFPVLGELPLVLGFDLFVSATRLGGDLFPSLPRLFCESRDSRGHRSRTQRRRSSERSSSRSRSRL
jgi:hypothetical protein